MLVARSISIRPKTIAYHGLANVHVRRTQRHLQRCPGLTLTHRKPVVHRTALARPVQCTGSNSHVLDHDGGGRSLELPEGPVLAPNRYQRLDQW